MKTVSLRPLRPLTMNELIAIQEALTSRLAGEIDIEGDGALKQRHYERALTKIALRIIALQERLEEISKESAIYTIFGDVEAIAANSLIEKYRLHKIEVSDFPSHVSRINSHGTEAKFAVIIPGERMIEFNDLIADLRA